MLHLTCATLRRGPPRNTHGSPGSANRPDFWSLKRFHAGAPDSKAILLRLLGQLVTAMGVKLKKQERGRLWTFGGATSFEKPQIR